MYSFENFYGLFLLIMMEKNVNTSKSDSRHF